MRKFLIKTLIFFFPLLVAVVVYFIADPFKVLYYHSSYFKPRQNLHIFLNRDHVATEMLLHKNSTQNYNAFIFGSSRSDNYLVEYWKPHLPADANCFHFSASAEGLYGVERKVNLIANRGIDLKYALIALDHWLLEITEDSKGRVFMKHYVQSGQNPVIYQYKYFEDYFNEKFLTSYAQYLFTGSVTAEMKKKEVMVDVQIAYNDTTNEMTYPALDSQHKLTPEAYYKTRLQAFVDHPRSDTQTLRVLIGARQRALLQSIRETFRKNKTDYMIVINPMYDQLKLHPNDMKMLYQLFGEENVCDMSGKNEWTQDYHRHFDYFHFDYEVGKQVLDSAYARRSRMRATPAR